MNPTTLSDDTARRGTIGFGAAVGASVAREWRFLCRSPWDMALIGWMPALILILMAALFHSAVPRALPVAVVDDSRSDISRTLIRALQAAPALDLRAQPQDLHTAWSLMRALQVYAVLHIPQDVDQQVQQSTPATLFVFYNAMLTTAGATAFRDMDAAIQQVAGRILLEHRALQAGIGVLRAPPVQAQVTVLFNPARSFEQFLLGLLIPGLLHLMLCMAVTSAFCRELRDSTVSAWLAACGGHLPGAIVGKCLPYVALFSLYGLAGVLWVTVIRGDGIPGQGVWRFVSVLLAGQGLMYAAYAAIGLLLAGVARTMASALSVVGLYAGTSLAFCGATFPIDGAPLFARLWNALLPFTHYVTLDAAERYLAAPASVVLGCLGLLALFVVIPGTLGYFAYRRSARDPARWGLR